MLNPAVPGLAARRTVGEIIDGPSGSLEYGKSMVDSTALGAVGGFDSYGATMRVQTGEAY